METTDSAIYMEILESMDSNMLSLLDLIRIQIALTVLSLYPILKGVVDKWFKL
jgi:hypothetical protein